MTTKTTIALSPIKRSSPKLKKRRMTSLFTNRKYQTDLFVTIPKMISSPTTITVSCEKQNLPDLINDLYIEQQEQQRETIITIARILRKVGDQMDERLQVRNIFSVKEFFFTIIYLD
jgi:hypothetical protein